MYLYFYNLESEKLAENHSSMVAGNRIIHIFVAIQIIAD